MRTIRSIHSLALVLCTCSVVLIAGAGANAVTFERLLFAPAGESTFTSAGTVSFVTGVATLRCNVTMSGSFNGAITARSGETIASISRASATGCEGGERASVTFLSLPWSLTYSSFSGTQPEGMTAVLASLNGVSASGSVSGLACLYRGNVGLRFPVRGTDPYEVGTLATLTNSLSLVSGAFCSSTGSMNGSFTFSVRRWMGEQLMQPLRPNADMIPVERTQAAGGVSFGFQNITPERTDVETGTVGMTRLGYGGSNFEGCSFRRVRPDATCPVTLVGEVNAIAPALLQVRDRATGAVVGVARVIP